MLDSNEPLSAAEQAHWDRVDQQEAAFAAWVEQLPDEPEPFVPDPNNPLEVHCADWINGKRPKRSDAEIDADWAKEAVRHEAERLRKLRYWRARVEREKRGESVYSDHSGSNYWIKSTRSDPEHRVDLQESLERIAAERSIDRTPPLPPLT